MYFIQRNIYTLKTSEYIASRKQTYYLPKQNVFRLGVVCGLRSRKEKRQIYFGSKWKSGNTVGFNAPREIHS